jgi:hypothetical protein
MRMVGDADPGEKAAISAGGDIRCVRRLLPPIAEIVQALPCHAQLPYGGDRATPLWWETSGFLWDACRDFGVSELWQGWGREPVTMLNVH